MNYENQIGRRLAALRKEQNLTQNRLADLLFLQRGQIAKWEAGESIPKVEYIIKYADFFDTTCDYILRGYIPENRTVVQELGLSNESIELLKEMKNGGIVRFVDFLLSERQGFDMFIRQIERAIKFGIYQKKLSDHPYRGDSWKYQKSEITLPDGTSIFTNEIIDALRTLAYDNMYNLFDKFIDAEVRNAQEENNP